MTTNKTKIKKIQAEIEQLKQDDAKNIVEFIKDKLYMYDVILPYCNLEENTCYFAIKNGEKNIPFRWRYYENIYRFGNASQIFNAADLKIINDVLLN